MRPAILLAGNRAGLAGAGSYEPVPAGSVIEGQIEYHA